jgi:hypothetical protein
VLDGLRHLAGLTHETDTRQYVSTWLDDTREGLVLGVLIALLIALAVPLFDQLSEMVERGTPAP